MVANLAHKATPLLVELSSDRFLVLPPPGFAADLQIRPGTHSKKGGPQQATCWDVLHLLMDVLFCYGHGSML